MKPAAALILTSLCLSGSVFAADFSFTLTGTSDYRYRGISQTAGDWALQGSADLEFENGFYAGAWASNVDFGDDADLEIDWYGGYYFELTDSAGLDVMLNYYSYPGYSEDGDYLELITTLELSQVSFQWAYANDYFNTGDSAHYLAADYGRELAETAGVFEAVSLDLHAGYSFGDYWDVWDIGDYADYSIGVSATWGRAELALAYLYNSVDGAEKVNRGAYRNDDTLLFTVSTQFGF